MDETNTQSRGTENFNKKKKKKKNYFYINVHKNFIKQENFCGVDLYNGFLIRFIKASQAYLGQSEDSVVVDFNYYRADEASTPRLNQDVWEEVEQLNHPDMALVESACVAIGSHIYAISGLNAYSLEPCLRDGEGSNKIRCIDTLNPQHGWNTCFTLPFSRGKGMSFPFLYRIYQAKICFWSSVFKSLNLKKVMPLNF